MLITVYNPLSDEIPNFTLAKVTDISTVERYEYRKSMTEVGSFSLVIPSNAFGADLIKVGMILHANNEDCLIIRNINETESSYEIEGKDLKDLLNRRITVFPTEEWEAGTYGHDVIKGSTEKCIKHYIVNNITNPANKKRKIYGFICKPDKGRGLKDDNYMSRLDPLNEIVAEMCKNVKSRAEQIDEKKESLGYDVVINIDNNSYDFDVFEPVDKTDNQTENNKVVFGLEFKNVGSISHNHGDLNEKNTLFAINDGAKPWVQQVNVNETEAYGIDRKETVANISCEIEDIDVYAMKAAEDMMKNNTFEMSAGNINDYGVLYTLGDKVTFKYKNLILDSVIIEVIKRFDGNDAQINIITGEKTPKPINKTINRINIAKTDIKESLLNKADNAPPIASIQVNGDNDYIITTKYGTEEFKACT